MTQEERHRCVTVIHSCERGWPREHQCTKTVTIARDGMWFCKIHDPVDVQRRRAEQRAAYEAKYAQARRMRLYGQVGEKLLYMLKKLVASQNEETLREARQLIEEVEKAKGGA